MDKILRVGWNSLLLTFLLSSCDPSMVYEESKNLHGADWSKDSSLLFQVHIKDTVSSQNILITTRNSGAYPWSNLFLFLTTTAPTGATLRDTIEIALAKPNGQWIGKGIGDLHYVRTPWRHNVRFPYAGVYTFQITQGMRVDNLHGIGDIGLRIEKTDN